MSRKNCTQIGGQAVLEGVMMRGKAAEAVAVRDPYGAIQVESVRLEKKKPIIARIPFVRGVYSLVMSLIDGSRILMRSSEVYGDDAEQETTKFDRFLEKHFKIDAVKFATVIGTMLGLLLAVALFVLLPTYIKKGVMLLLKDADIAESWKLVIESLIVGVVKIAIFIVYLLAVSAMKEIKRLFAYHGAEHKTISCYESGDELTVENVKKHSRLHDRCGTNFIFIVMIVSIIVNAIFFALIFALTGWKPSHTILEVLIRIGLLPIVAGFSYEALKFLAKFDNPLVKVLKAPGLALQLITTKEPENDMIEVAIKAFTTVMELEANPDMPTSEFVTYVKCSALMTKLKEIISEGEAELIVMNKVGWKKRSDINAEHLIAKPIADEAEAIAKERAQGKPLQYLLKTAPFYGYDFNVDGRVLIPRFDTELMAEAAIKEIKGRGGECKVLELCTGSGAVAVTIAKETAAEVIASDISKEALEVARSNAELNGADVKFIESDLFGEIDGKYDVIVANPPYIPTDDIENLDAEVKDYEPMLALDGGKDGLEIYRRIASDYKGYLNEGGVIMLEVGIGEAEAVKELMGGEGEVIEDYNDPPVPRVVIVRV